MPTPVDRLHDEFEDLVSHLQGEPSQRSTADDGFRKLLLMSAASFFESTLTEYIEQFSMEASNSSSLIAGIIKTKAISRQYHTWFDWKGNNANQFYSLFGKDFLAFMKKKHVTETWLDASVQAFMELGRSRNLLVHENFASFSLEKTASELFASYKTALRFVEAIPEFLRECNRLHTGGGVSRSESSDAPILSSLQELRLRAAAKYQR
jgi:hypothetical protein